MRSSATSLALWETCDPFPRSSPKVIRFASQFRTSGKPATQTSAPVVPPKAHGPAASALAIPDYDSLSASQVVPRLEGLSGEELASVEAYEAEHRGRKTILNKIAQLQS